jgi:hypothetical protein
MCENFCQVRNAFMPRQGRILLSIDYVQCELRIMAHFSQDATLISLLQVYTWRRLMRVASWDKCAMLFES